MIVGFNAFIGKNGCGKTNILDGIHFLSTGKSLFHRKDALSIMHEKELLTIQAEIQGEKKSEKWHIGISHDEKLITRDSIKVKKLSEHIGKLPVVFINPDSINSIKGMADDRRRVFDKMLCQASASYLNKLVDYTKLMQQRKALLKMFFMRSYFDELALQGIDSQIHPLANWLHKFRKQALKKWFVLAANIYSEITNGSEKLRITYISDLNEQTNEDLFSNSKSNDIAACRTTKGIHKDDILIELNGYQIKKYGSQGQIKSATIAIHLASLEYIYKEKGILAILLLDDIFEKIDDQRSTQLLKTLAKYKDLQVFITDTDKDRVKRNLNKVKTAKKITNIEAD